MDLFHHREMIALLKRLLCVAERSERDDQAILHELKAIRRELEPRHHIPFAYRITQENSMPIKGIIPGSTGTFAANPLDASGNPITTSLSVVPLWTSSDPLAVVTPSADGLNSSVAVDGTAPQGGSFELSVSNPDGSAVNTVTVPYNTAPPPPNVPAAYGISQTS